MSGSNNSGNRQDNRQRGNAAQLLEKYKSMARDSQLAGDRVQTEYYLQFADHYFRVLGDSRPRADEQQRRERGDDDGYVDDDGDDRIDGDNEHDGDSDDEQPQRSRPRPSADPRRERPQPRDNGDERIDFAVLPPAIGSDDSGDFAAAADDAAPRPKRRVRRPRADDAGGDDAAAS